jgi:hypothetical protein
MYEHDVDLDGPVGAPSQREPDHDAPPGRELGRGIEAGRPDALGPGGLLHLQQTAGNSGVSALVAQRAASPGHSHDDGHDHEGEADDGPSARSPVNDVVGSSGQPLDTGVRADMESAMGHDFGDVQIHTDGQAAASAKSVQAQAYTVGNHVVFNDGAYRPESPEGRRMLAHELTHVVQQRQGPVDGTPAAGGIKVSDPSDRFEREAESNADRVMSAPAAAPAPAASEPAPVQRAEEPGAEPPVQRQAAEEETEEEAPPEAGAEAAPPSEAPASEAAAPEAAGAEEAAPEAAAPEGAAPEAAGAEEAGGEEEAGSGSPAPEGAGPEEAEEEVPAGA